MSTLSLAAPAAFATDHATDGTTASSTSHGANAHDNASPGKAHDSATPGKAHANQQRGTSGTSGTSGDPSQPQPLSDADQNTGGANGACPGGPYCSTRDGSPSGNGNGNGQATGKPCAGCVGKADNKNPPGQYPDGTDANAGYECDRNHGIGRTNPAHTGCITPTVSDCTATPNAPECNPGGTECIPTAANNFCSEVIGTHKHRPTVSPPTTVLGERFVRTPRTLPFTGADIVLLVGIAMGTMAGGSLLLVSARRRRNSA